jgi:hypothetical protein
MKARKNRDLLMYRSGEEESTVDKAIQKRFFFLHRHIRRGKVSSIIF